MTLKIYGILLCFSKLLIPKIGSFLFNHLVVSDIFWPGHGAEAKDVLFAAPMLFISGPVQQGGENLEHNFNVHLQRLLPLHQVTTALLVSVTGCFLSSLCHLSCICLTNFALWLARHAVKIFYCNLCTPSPSFGSASSTSFLILLHGSLFNHPTFSREIKLSSLLWSLLRMTPSPPTVHEVKKIRSQGSMDQSQTGYWVPSKKNSLFT